MVVVHTIVLLGWVLIVIPNMHNAVCPQAPTVDKNALSGPPQTRGPWHTGDSARQLLSERLPHLCNHEHHQCPPLRGKGDSNPSPTHPPHSQKVQRLWKPGRGATSCEHCSEDPLVRKHYPLGRPSAAFELWVHHPRCCLLTTTHTVTTCSRSLSNWVVLNLALRVCTGPGLEPALVGNCSDSRFQGTMRLHVISLNCSAPSAIFDVNSSTRAVSPLTNASCRSDCRSSIHWQSSAGIKPGIIG